MKVALVSEGTYPYAMGGVSVWCEQLIRGMPDYRWEVVALTVDGNERPVFDLPDNLDRVYPIPLWQPDTAHPGRSRRGGPRAHLRNGVSGTPKHAPAGFGGRRIPAIPRPRRSAGSNGAGLAGRSDMWDLPVLSHRSVLAGFSTRAGQWDPAFAAVHEAFITALVTPLRSGSDEAAVARSRFLLALRGMYEYAAAGGDLAAALMSNRSLAMMVEIWNDLRADDSSPAPTLADALDAVWLIEHMLRPLTATPVEADVVHSSMNGLSMLVGFAAKWRHGTPLVMSEHGIYLRERYISFLGEDAPHPVKVLILSFFRCLAGAAYLLSDALTPHSAYNRRWQLHNGADANRMWTMYNGVEPTEFPPSASEPDVPTISFIGRIDPLKDIHTLVRAFAIVREKIPAAKLRIFGGTPAINRGYHEGCQRLIDELGLAGSATMEGPVGQPIDAYHAGSIVALTSISEGFPYTVIEAMSCGKPVVATNVGGVSEAVADTGIVVAPRDVEAVADACLQLLGDPERRRRLGAAARQRVLDRFTLAQSIEAYRKVYRSVTAPVHSTAETAQRPQASIARGTATVVSTPAISVYPEPVHPVKPVQLPASPSVRWDDSRGPAGLSPSERLASAQPAASGHDGIIPVSGSLPVTGALSVSGPIELVGPAGPIGSVQLQGSLTVSGSLTLTGYVEPSGNVVLSGTARLSEANAPLAESTELAEGRNVRGGTGIPGGARPDAPVRPDAAVCACQERTGQELVLGAGA